MNNSHRVKHGQAVMVTLSLFALIGLALSWTSNSQVELITAGITGTPLFLPLIVRGFPPITPTNTASPTPTASATATPSGVFILNNSSTYVDSNYRRVVGEVQNNTSDTLRFVKIIVDYFDSNNQLVANDYTYIHLDNLPPSTKTCFEVFTPNPVGYAYYQFEAPTYHTDGQVVGNLTVLSPSGSYNSTYGWYTLIGLVRNDNPTIVKYVSPIGTLYNASQTVIGCDYTYVNSTDLNPGQLSSFTITFSGRNYNDVASYILQVDGNSQ